MNTRDETPAYGALVAAMLSIAFLAAVGVFVILADQGIIHI